MKSIFTDKMKEPTVADLKNAIGSNYQYWKQLADFANKSYPGALNKWHYSGDKFGWSFRISDKKRVLIYLLPRDRFFKVAFVFGQKSTNEILSSNVSDNIKIELKSAKVFAEGRGIRIEVKNKTSVDDIKKLITIKISNRMVKVQCNNKNVQ